MWRRWFGAAAKFFCVFFGDKPSTWIFLQSSTLLLNDMFEIYGWFVEDIEDWGCWRMLSDITIWGNCHRLFVQKRPSLLFFGGNDQPQKCFEVGGSWLESWLHVTRSLDQICVFLVFENRATSNGWTMLLEIQGSKLPTDLCCCGRWIFATFWSCYLDCWGEESREDPNF